MWYKIHGWEITRTPRMVNSPNYRSGISERFRRTAFSIVNAVSLSVEVFGERQYSWVPDIGIRYRRTIDRVGYLRRHNFPCHVNYVLANNIHACVCVLYRFRMKLVPLLPCAVILRPNMELCHECWVFVYASRCCCCCMRVYTRRGHADFIMRLFSYQWLVRFTEVSPSQCRDKVYFPCSGCEVVVEAAGVVLASRRLHGAYPFSNPFLSLSPEPLLPLVSLSPPLYLGSFLR